MADGKKILEKASTIKEAAPSKSVVLENHSTSLQQNESVSFGCRD